MFTTTDNVYADQDDYSDIKFDCAPWLEDIFKPQRLANLADRSKNILEQFRKNHPFDAIAFRGMSGALLSSILSASMQIPLIMVRKNGESASDPRNECGYFQAKRYIIVDDLCHTGQTIKIIHNAVQKFCHHDTQLVAVALYSKLNYSVGEIGYEKLPEYKSPVPYPVHQIRLFV